MNVRFIRPLVVSPGMGKSETRLGGMKAPEALSTVCPKPLMPWTRRNPPGQKPSFCVSTLRVYSARPKYRATSSFPPLATTWGSCNRSMSRTTPLLPSASRSPPATGEARPEPEVATPRSGDVYGLRARGACHEQHDQAKDHRPRAGGAMHGDVQTHMVLLQLRNRHFGGV